MKRTFVLIILTCLLFSAYCQNIGLRANIGFSENKEMNTAFGGGLYLNIDNDSLKMFDYILFGDYMSRKNTFNDCLEYPTPDISTSYKKLSFGLSGLLNNKIHANSRLKIGPSLSYNTLIANRQGQIANWIETFKAKYFGTGLLANIQLQQIFKLPINFDIFISSFYLINIKDNSNPTGIKSDYSDNLVILNLRFGLSYKM